VGSKRKTPFWQAPQLYGTKPIEITPLIYASSKGMNWRVSQALHDEAWIGKIDMGQNFTFDHLTQFIELWVLVNTYTWMPMFMMTSFGGLREIGNIHPCRLMRPIFRLYLIQYEQDGFEGLGSSKVQILCLAHHPK
jgi:hypothetical protein